MALIAVPFGETLRMRGGHLMGVGLAVIIGSVFWFIFSMAIALGHSGKLPSLLSAYGAHLVFGFTAVSMLLTNKQ
jgi:lipopolysaccharide export LptBFGC system permease protein LptF